MASSPNEPAPPPLLGAHCCLSMGDGRLAFKAEDGADAGEGSSSLPRGRLRSPPSPLSKSLQTISRASGLFLCSCPPPHPSLPQGSDFRLFCSYSNWLPSSSLLPAMLHSQLRNRTCTQGALAASCFPDSSRAQVSSPGQNCFCL